MISIITATYNSEKTIKATIESILNQTYSDWELILVDDGSTDNTMSILEQYCLKDSRIKLYTHDNHKNAGLIKTLQLAITKAKNELIQFCEHDDLLKPDAIDKKVKIFEKYPNVSLVFSDVERFGVDFPEAKKYTKGWCIDLLNSISYPSKINFEAFKYKNFFETFSVVMCRKSVLLKCSFDSPIDAYIDWYLWSQMTDEYMYFINEPLTLWRMGSGSYSKIFKERKKSYIIGKYRLAIKQNIKGEATSKRSFQLLAYNIIFLLKEVFFVKNSKGKSHIIITVLGFKIKIRNSKNAKS